MKLKQILKRWAPHPVIELYRACVRLRDRIHSLGMTNAQIFSAIYAKKQWGDDGEYCSGSGTINGKITDRYVQEISPIIRVSKGRVVDIGCGDFRIGQRLFANLQVNYVACDVVPELIAHHHNNYKGIENLEFVTLDAARDELPDGEIALVRQVLQHLNNRDIHKILKKLHKYKTVVITEHHPYICKAYNADKFTGSRVRMENGSGVYLDQAPFQVVGQLRLLFEVPGDATDPRKSGWIRTFIWNPETKGV